MLIITLRTDNPEAEIGLYEDAQQLAYYTWTAHRQLAETLHGKIRDVLTGQQKQLSDLQGIVIFKGPGSFTGLRIGFSVANALAYSLHTPIVSALEPSWLETGIAALQAGANETVALPEYGALPHITPQKK